MEEALTGWLRSEITRIEQQQLAKLTDPLLEARVEFSKLAEALGGKGCLSVRAEWRAANGTLRSLRFSPGRAYCE